MPKYALPSEPSTSRRSGVVTLAIALLALGLVVVPATEATRIGGKRYPSAASLPALKSAPAKKVLPKKPVGVSSATVHGTRAVASTAIEDPFGFHVADVNNAPHVTSPTGPADGTVVTSSSTMPTLAVYESWDDENDPIKYRFKVTTRSDAETGTIIADTAVSAISFQLPPGSLKDGITYYWHVYTTDALHPSGTAPGWVQSFRVDYRLGTRKTMPFDSVGPASVNLVSGNLVVGASSATVGSLAGPLGVSFVYNSQTPAAETGLIGTYTADPNGNHTVDSGEASTLVRRDPTINFDWGATAPVPGLTATNTIGRWTGFVRVPSSGDYLFGATTSDGVKVRVDNNLVVDSWTDQAAGAPIYGSSVHLGGTAVPITIDWYKGNTTGAATLKLYVKGAASTTWAESLVPSDWLSPDAGMLPRGWGMSPIGGDGLSYVRAEISDAKVVLVGPDGDTHLYTSNGTGYTPPKDEDGVLARSAKGTVTLEADDGMTYEFGPSGSLQSATSTSALPASHRYTWATPSGSSLPRLTGMTDPVSNRAVTLRYGGDSSCPASPPSGFDSGAPSGMLCAVELWDGRVTKLWYVGGRLGRVENPGASVSDFAYDTNGRLAKIRDPHAADMVAAGRADDDTTRTLVAYDSTGRVTSVTLGEPTASALRPGHSYDYASSTQTKVHVVGLTEPNGYARQVTFDASGRQTVDTDATNRSVTYAWDTSDRIVATTDSSGLMSTSIYDWAGRQTDSYGPSPAAWFGTDNKPLAAYVSQVPHQSTAYDETWKSLDVVYFDNGNFQGAPVAHTLGMGDATGALNGSWTTTAPPGITSTTTDWSARLTGEVTMAQTGAYVITPNASGRARVSIDDLQIVDTATATNGTFTNAVAGSHHRIRVDYSTVSTQGSTASATLGYTGASQQWVVPAGVSSVTVEAWGAQGGNGGMAASSGQQGAGYGAIGAKGGYIKGTIAVTPGETLGVVVGGVGKTATTTNNESAGGYPDGGHGGLGQNVEHGGGGGGSSSVSRSTTKLIIGGGGGGAGGAYIPYLCCEYQDPYVGQGALGGGGGYPTGQAGAAGGERTDLSNYPYYFPGIGGAGGAAGLGTGTGGGGDWIGIGAMNGGGGGGGGATGGAAGTWGCGAANFSTRRCFDGARYYNGGGGSGGGGGSSYFNGTVADYATANRSGDGQVVFSWPRIKSFGVSWQTPAGVGELIPGTALAPRYGLSTSQVDVEGKKSVTEYDHPELGLATASVADSNGLALRSTTAYEAFGSGYLRPLSRRLPKGASTEVTTAYYGATEAVDDPCVAGTALVNQGGRAKTTTAADPDGAGGTAPIVREQIYDVAGRVVANRVVGDLTSGGAAAWSCVTYDDRDRVVTSADRLGGTTTTTYGASTVSSTGPDSSGASHTTSATVDLLGSTLTYTDELGTVSRFVIDQVGRVTESYRTFASVSEQKVTSATYDAAGRVLTQTDWLTAPGRTATTTYDTAGRPATLLRPNGVVSTSGYEANTGRLSSLGYTQGSTSNRTSQTFSYTGSGQTWTVPAGVTEITVDAFGAQGGGGTSLGGEAKSTVSVTPGETLDVYVGGAGGAPAGGFNGGGSGNTFSVGGGYQGSGPGGGGASDVRRGSGWSGRLVVAGGGGGGLGNLPGGAGGGTSGEAGAVTSQAVGFGSPGGGGTQLGGGAAGSECCTTGPTAGGVGVGGNGAAANTAGGGGGGGYFGGGGSGSAYVTTPGYEGYFPMGGGGGSSYTSGVLSSTSTGVRTGNGQVVITWASTPLPSLTYTYSKAGRLTSELVMGVASRVRTYTYDGVGRLTAATDAALSNAGTRNYAYDADTNRCGLATSCESANWQYDNADRITKSPYASSYTYDAHGNVTQEVLPSTSPTVAGVAGLTGGPFSVIVDSAHNLYYSDANANRVYKIAAGSGTATVVAGTGTSGYSGDGGAATAATLSIPAGLAVDASGALYIADYLNNRVRKVSAAGVISTVVGTGTTGSSGDGGSATSATLNLPHSLAFDASGNLYISEFHGNRIRKVSTTGNISTVVGTGSATESGDGGPATSAGIKNPRGIAFDAAGNLLLADDGGYVRKVSPTGSISSLAGTGTMADAGDGGPASSAGLNWPSSVAVDGAGNVYVGEYYRIRKIGTTGNISTIAGTGVNGNAGNGGSASAALFNFVSSVAVDGSSNELYFVDSASATLRHFSVAPPNTANITYDANDHATVVNDGTTTITETLAPSGRVLRRVVTPNATGTPTEDTSFGYSGGGDSPAYSRPTSSGPVTTYLTGIGGLVDVGGTATWSLYNAHGDVLGSTNAAGAFTAAPATDEFGVGSTPASRLGWLGQQQRPSVGGQLGLFRMGVRLYDPALGRFLEVDPVEGGSANDYDYCNGDPVNCFDLAGTWGFHMPTMPSLAKMATSAVKSVAKTANTLAKSSAGQALKVASAHIATATSVLAVGLGTMGALGCAACGVAAVGVGAVSVTFTGIHAAIEVADGGKVRNGVYASAAFAADVGIGYKTGAAFNSIGARGASATAQMFSGGFDMMTNIFSNRGHFRW
jgi:RHS repeat-associated protein